LSCSLDFNEVKANFEDIQKQYWGNFFGGSGVWGQFGPIWTKFKGDTRRHISKLAYAST